MSNKYKHLGYETINRNVTLLGDIADIEPYTLTLPEPPEIELIENFGLRKEEQFFKRERIPRKIWELTKLVNAGMITRKEAFATIKKDKELKAFVQQQWHYREHGKWVFIYGKAIYLTGTYWFFLNYYNMKGVGYPGYRQTQMERALWWKFCVEENESVYGGIEFTRRREGKSHWAGNILVEYATKTGESDLGHQSKSEKDAAKFIDKDVVYPFKRLAFFWMPEYDGTGKMKGGIKLESADIETSLETKIDFESTTPTAYDGQKLKRWVGDEFGKMENPADPIEIWDKNKLCFFDDGQIIGKALITSTVEEMTRGGGHKFHYLWSRSSRIPKDAMINEFGETATGLVPYFTPAFKNMFFDQWGNSIIETPSKEQKEYRKNKKDRFWNIGGKEYVDTIIKGAKNNKDKQDIIRKHPRTIREAFTYNNMECLFDIGVINERLQYFFGSANSIYPRNYSMTFGYFQWVKGKEYKEAEFIVTDEKSARCHIRYMPPQDQRNRWGMKNGKQTPANTMRFNAGADPFKLKTEQVIHRDRMSEGAGHVYALLDPAVDNLGKPREEWLTDNFVLEYLFRPETPDLFAEDMAMICVFYGCKIFPENNINIIDKCFREWELGEYLQFQHKTVMRNNIAVDKQDKTIAGAYNIDSLKPTLIRHGINFIREKGMYMPFPRSLEQFRDLSYDNFTSYDAAVSGLFTLCGVFDAPIKKQSVNKVDFGNQIPIPSLRSYPK